MRKTLLDEINACSKPPTVEEQQDTLSDMVDFEFFCNKYYVKIWDWLEDNHPEDICNRAEEIELERFKNRYDNMSKKELKADESEHKGNCKVGRE